ncbi:hypothetical protein [Conexibacter woesei]|uniref:hypothetical protein n=1 Tax=Conexibacter woesei TaxID=191495 RepID=UPI000426DD70|nr:hypothetical protein [Conexibacter woesei]
MSARILVLGDHNPEYSTHRELDAVLDRLRERGLTASWHATDAGALPLHDALWIAPGSPYRDEPAVLAAIGAARREGTPLLGTCGGFQFAALELGRALAGVPDPRHAESDPDAPAPFIAPLDCRVDGARRTVTPTPGTRLAQLLGTAPFEGLFFCGYAPSAAAEDALERAGIPVTARAQGIGAVALELPGHPFFLATLFHPQAGTLAGAPLSPLIEAFADAALDRAQVAA